MKTYISAIFLSVCASGVLFAENYYSSQNWNGKNEVFSLKQTFYADWTSSGNIIEAPKISLQDAAAWKSTDDTITTDDLSLAYMGSSNSGTIDIARLNLTAVDADIGKAGTISASTLNVSESLRLGSRSTSSASLISIEDSEINAGWLSIEGANNSVVLKNSNTYLNMSGYSSSIIGSGASVTIDGGSFTANLIDTPRSLYVNSSTLVVKNAEMNMSGAVLGTRVGGTQDAIISFVGSTFSGTMDLYAYDSNSNTSILNISENSNVSVKSLYASQEGLVRGGTINVDNSTFAVESAMAQADDSGTQIYTTKLNLTNGADADIGGALDISSVSVNASTLSADSIVVGAGRTMSVVGASTVEADLLSVYDGASVSLDESATLNISALELILSELESGTTYDLADIFGDDTTIVLSAVNGNITMSDENGHSFDAIVSDGGVITAVPEPSTCATIVGILALLFAAYRKRS